MTRRQAIRIHQNTAAARLSFAAISAFKISSCDSIAVSSSRGYTADFCSAFWFISSLLAQFPTPPLAYSTWRRSTPSARVPSRDRLSCHLHDGVGKLGQRESPGLDLEGS